MHLLKLPRISIIINILLLLLYSINLLTVKIVHCIQLKSINKYVFKLWIAVEKAIFSYLNCMRLQRFIDDKYISLHLE